MICWFLNFEIVLFIYVLYKLVKWLLNDLLVGYFLVVWINNLFNNDLVVIVLYFKGVINLKIIVVVLNLVVGEILICIFGWDCLFKYIVFFIFFYIYIFLVILNWIKLFFI